MARDLVASGEGLAAVQVAGRWTFAQMPAHYARGELASKGAVARLHREDWAQNTLHGGGRTVGSLATVLNARAAPRKEDVYHAWTGGNTGQGGAIAYWSGARVVPYRHSVPAPRRTD